MDFVATPACRKPNAKCWRVLVYLPHWLVIISLRWSHRYSRLKASVRCPSVCLSVRSFFLERYCGRPISVGRIRSVTHRGQHASGVRVWSVFTRADCTCCFDIPRRQYGRRRGIERSAASGCLFVCLFFCLSVCPRSKRKTTAAIDTKLVRLFRPRQHLDVH